MHTYIQHSDKVEAELGHILHTYINIYIHTYIHTYIEHSDKVEAELGHILHTYINIYIHTTQ